MFVVRFILSNLFGMVLLVAILLAKRILKNKVSLKFHYHIWFILLFSLVIVFLPMSLFETVGFGDITQQITAPINNKPGSVLVPPDMPEDWRYDFTEMTSATNNGELDFLVITLWVIGVLVVGIFYYMGSRRLRMIKRFAEPMQDNIVNIYHNCYKRICPKRKICLMQSDLITSPISFGCRLSYIILPCHVVNHSSEKEIEHILLHELTHIKHNDIWANFWLCAEQAIYWFNPFLWWAFAKMRKDREAYCDWSVLNGYNSKEERLSYGDTLLRFASQKNNTMSYTANGLFDDKKQIRYRIERIAEFQKETKASRFIGRSFIFLLTLIMVLQVPAFAMVASDFGLSYQPKRGMTTVECDYSQYFGDAKGSAIVFDLNSDVYQVYNSSVITKRIAPCSTVKIFSGLNALEKGIITPSENTMKWDNMPRGISAWDRDQNLYSAMSNSVNWYFQLLDKSVGAEELEEFYARIGYGNEYIGGDTSYYWNGSKLKISPLEQVELLIKLYQNEFGFHKENVDTIKDAMFIMDINGNKLYGKTGTGKIGSNDVNGWFIGYVESKANVYFFAVNLQDEANANGNAAAEIAFSIFDEMGIDLNK